MARPLPRIAQVVLDTTDARALAEFYRQLFGLEYRPGDEPDAHGGGGADLEWLVLRNPHGGPQLAFQQTEGVRASSWPAAEVPQMLHLDTVVSSIEELHSAHAHAMSLGARVLLDRTDDEEEPLFVYADPAGHPFCIFVG